MIDLQIRYDMRRPAFAPCSSTAMYKAAIDQCVWAEQKGFRSIFLSEHHGSDDGYCPSPLLLASAIASKTSSIRLFIAALIAPLHEPARLAEDLAVLDIISEGRVTPILSAGYRESEFTTVGKTLADRKDYMDNIVTFLQQAWSGQPFEHQGRTITITPQPHSKPRPMVLLGGSSRAAARRAAEQADFFIPSGENIFEYYRQELKKLGKPDPGPMPASPSTVTFVAPNPDEYWEQIAPHLLHETNSYAAWAAETGVFSPYQHFEDANSLRDHGTYQVFTPEELIDAASNMVHQQPVQFHPLCGGIDIELAWKNLNCFDKEVLPALIEEGIVKLKHLN